MKKIGISALFVLALACHDPADDAPAARVGAASHAAPTRAARQTLNIDPAQSSVGFTAAKVSMSHDGTFSQFSGRIELDPVSIENSTVHVDIQPGSVHIEPERLRNHLLTPDFFDVARFPTATFESTRIVRGGQGGTHTITGNLTLHGQTRALTFPANIELNPHDVHATAEFTVDRRDFGIVYPGMANDLINDHVTVRFDVRAPRG